jgi:imidazolonepropionase-like amidohydrolase
VVDGVDEAVALTRANLARGMDAIKIVTGWNARAALAPEIVSAVCAEAGRAGKLVFAHPQHPAGTRVAVENGVAILAHRVSSGERCDEDLLALMLEAEVSLVPTLHLWEYEAAREPDADPAAMLDAALHELAAFARSGGRILFGTDVGYMSDYDTAREFELMAAAGMDADAILASLTTAPAGRFGLAARTGRLASGMDADVVLLSGDPHADVTAFARVAYTIRAGRVVHGAR